MLKFIIGFSLLFLLTGCESVWLGKSYVAKTKLESSITSLKKEQVIAVEKAINEVTLAKDNYTAEILENFQFSSDWLYGARLGVELVPNKDRLWTVIDYRLKTAASYAPAPSREALESMNKTLKEELDTIKVSNEALADKYNEENKRAELAINDQKTKELIIAAKEKEVQAVKDDFNSKISGKQDELNAVNDKLLANEQKSNDERKIFEKNKKIVASSFGILALACLAGAFFSPIFKDKLGIGAALFGALAVGSMFITPLYVAIFFTVLLLIGVFFALKHFHVLDKTSANLIGYIDHLKEKNPEMIGEIKKDLTDFNSKYVKGAVGVVKVVDKQVDNFIDKKLVELQKK